MAADMAKQQHLVPIINFGVMLTFHAFAYLIESEICNLIRILAVNFKLLVLSVYFDLFR